MADHLSECCTVDDPPMGTWWCICDRLRAYGDRILSDVDMPRSEWERELVNRTLSAARDAVAALPDWSTFSEGLIYRDDALAAIDALRSYE